MTESRIKILVADDDADVQLFYKIALSEYFDVVIARDGLEAWKLFESEQPNLVVTDLNMPGVNGMVFTERIRAHATLGETPVIIITGTTRGTDLPPGFWKMGTKADAFLEKPLTGTELVNEVRRVLLKRQEAQQQPVKPNYLG